MLLPARRYNDEMSLAFVRIVLVISMIAALDARPAARPQAPTPVKASADAIRLNNLGVASMNQQKFEAALKYFEDAAGADPSLRVARTNQAIAQLALQRFDPARTLLEAAVKEQPDDVRAWYNLGLLQKSLGDAEASLAAFTRAAELRPRDPHAHYFAGLLGSQLQQYDTAVTQFQRALELDPFLVSAEFGLARAFQRAGKTEEARTHMERFSRLTQSKVASAMSLAYGDQGPLSLAEAVQPPPSAMPAIPVTFVADAASLAAGATPAATGDGPGLCLIDFNGDVAIDVVRLDGAGASLQRNDGKGSFAEAKRLIEAKDAVSCVAGDYDNDERPDIVVATASGVPLLHNDGEGTFTPAPADAGIPQTAGGLVAGVTFVDFDHDADLDLFVAGAATAVYRNNGNCTFTDVTSERGFALPGTRAITASDLNNDRAIDLIVTGESTAVLINPREGAFKPLAAFTPSVPAGTRGVAVLDFDKDGWMDLVFTQAAAPALSLWRNVAGTSFEQVALPSTTLSSGSGLAVIDYDNDGSPDIVASGIGAQNTSALVVLRNVQGSFEDATATVATKAVPVLKQPRALVAGDLDNDYDGDLVVADAGGPPVLLRNDGGNANKAIRLALAGLNDNRSGFGTKVEV